MISISCNLCLLLITVRMLGDFLSRQEVNKRASNIYKEENTYYIRVIAKQAPTSGAGRVHPKLEDVYLYHFHS